MTPAFPENLAAVLLLGPRLPARGGVSQFIENCLITKTGYVLEVFDTGRPTGYSEKGKTALGYRSLFSDGLFGTLKKILLTIFHLCKYPVVLLTKRPQIVQIQFSLNWSFWENAFYLFIAKIIGLKTICRFGSSNMESFFCCSNQLSYWIKCMILNSADRVIVQSQYWYRFFSHIVPEKRLVIIGNAVIVPQLLRQEQRNGRIHVLFEGGRDAKRKGAFDVLAAAGMLNSVDRSRVRFHCMACTPQIVEKVDALSLTDVVVLHDYVTGDEKAELFSQCDLFLLPSYSEGFPHSLLEAMAYGQVIIATPVGAIPEVVVEGVHGYLIQPGNIQALADCIRRLSEDRQVLQRMGQRNRELVLTNYSIEVLGKKLSALYQDVLQ